MIKPVLIYCFLSPQALNRKNMDYLPESGRYNMKMWVVRELLVD
jgi:hypothetical protein